MSNTSKSVEPIEEKVVVLEKGKKGKKPERDFEITSVVLNGETIPEFVSMITSADIPSGAGRKTAHKVCKKLFTDKDDNCVVDLYMKEITKNRTSKPYAYRAVRTLLNEPKNVDFKGLNDGKKYFMKKIVNEKGEEVEKRFYKKLVKDKDGKEIEVDKEAGIGFKFDMKLTSLKKNSKNEIVEDATVNETATAV